MALCIARTFLSLRYRKQRQTHPLLQLQRYVFLGIKLEEFLYWIVIAVISSLFFMKFHFIIWFCLREGLTRKSFFIPNIKKVKPRLCNYFFEIWGMIKTA